MWSRRAQEYEQKITSGRVYDLAEVVRDLNKGAEAFHQIHNGTCPSPKIILIP